MEYVNNYDDELYDYDDTKMHIARTSLLEYVDRSISTSYGSHLIMTHHCATVESEQQAPVKISGPISEIYKECKNKNNFEGIKAQGSISQDKRENSQLHPVQRSSMCK